ncbi:MAG: hypothetical protein OXU20_33890 [Myxococcales bacterium]|nr:hypothetical protein [Myxococcales bacterium]
MRALGRLSIMVTSAMLAACTDHGGPCAKHRFANGRACDIRDTSCQVQIFEAVRCVRGTEGTLPSVRVIDADTYRQELMPGPEADPDPDTSEETEAPTDHWSASLALLGLLPEDTTARAARTAEALDWVTAFYSALYRDVTIIDRGEPREPEDNVTLLAHEFVHALQDEVSGSEELSERGSRNDDAILARTALSEGEATLVEDLAYAALFDLSPHDLYPTEYYEYRLRWARNVALRADAPIRSFAGSDMAWGQNTSGLSERKRGKRRSRRCGTIHPPPRCGGWQGTTRVLRAPHSGRFRLTATGQGHPPATPGVPAMPWAR